MNIYLNIGEIVALLCSVYFPSITPLLLTPPLTTVNNFPISRHQLGEN